MTGSRPTPQAHNITKHRIDRLVGLTDIPQGRMEPLDSEVSQLGGEIMPRKTSENANC